MPNENHLLPASEVLTWRVVLLRGRVRLVARRTRAGGTFVDLVVRERKREVSGTLKTSEEGGNGVVVVVAREGQEEKLKEGGGEGKRGSSRAEFAVLAPRLLPA